MQTEGSGYVCLEGLEGLEGRYAIQRGPNDDDRVPSSSQKKSFALRWTDNIGTSVDLTCLSVQAVSGIRVEVSRDKDAS